MPSKISGLRLMNMQTPGGMKPAVPLRWLFCILYTVGLTVLSLIPSDNLDKIPLIMPHEDKVAHFILYAGMVTAFWWALRMHGTDALRKLIFTAFVCSLYGLFLEFMQEVLQPEDRDMSMLDAAANFCGALTAAFFLIRWTKQRTVKQVYLR